MTKSPIKAEPEIYTDVADLDFYIKNGLLFGIYKGEPHAFIRENPDADMLNALSHFGAKLPLAILDEESYDALKDVFLNLEAKRESEASKGSKLPKR